MSNLNYSHVRLLRQAEDLLGFLLLHRHSRRLTRGSELMMSRTIVTFLSWLRICTCWPLCLYTRFGLPARLFEDLRKHNLSIFRILLVRTNFLAQGCKDRYACRLTEPTMRGWKTLHASRNGVVGWWTGGWREGVGLHRRSCSRYVSQR